MRHPVEQRRADRLQMTPALDAICPGLGDTDGDPIFEEVFHATEPTV
jgi:hypothetical protein